MSQSITTVDDLSIRLKSARYKRWLDKQFNVKYDEMPKKLPKMKNVASALDYINKRCYVGIDFLGFDHLKDDARACILYDLAHFPTDMVVARLQSEGAVIGA